MFWSSSPPLIISYHWSYFPLYSFSLHFSQNWLYIYIYRYPDNKAYYWTKTRFLEIPFWPKDFIDFGACWLVSQVTSVSNVQYVDWAIHVDVKCVKEILYSFKSVSNRGDSQAFMETLVIFAAEFKRRWHPT